MAYIELNLGTEANTTGAGYPYNTYYHDSRIQYIILASELLSLGMSANFVITGISLKPYQSPGRNLATFYIRMQHTSLIEFPSMEWINSGFNLYYHATNIPAEDITAAIGSWYEHIFNQGSPFVWDGTSNILIDIYRDDSGYTSGGGHYIRTGLSGTRILIGYQDSGSSYPDTCTIRSSASLIPSTRITYTPAAVDVRADKLSVGSTSGGYLIRTKKDIPVRFKVINGYIYFSVDNGKTWISL